MTNNPRSLTPLALLSLMCFVAFVWGGGGAVARLREE